MIKNNLVNHSDASSSAIQLIGVTREFVVGGVLTTALDDIHLSIQNGEFVSVVGRSGSGKSTLMNMVTGIDHPTQGDVVVMGTHTHQLPENQMAAWRGSNLGIVFQFYQLLPTLSLLDNVVLPMQLINTIRHTDQLERAKDLLKAVDLWEKKDKYPAQLSGGEQQRAAVARAMANDPPILIADEPTGNLGSSEAGQVLALLSRMVSSGKSVVFVTHDLELANTAHRKITLSDGRIIDDSKINSPRKKAVKRKR
jgi:putative ABC transport system ATP-binding protein